MLVMDIARRNNLKRIKRSVCIPAAGDRKKATGVDVCCMSYRCSTIMGREEGDDMPAAQIMYPCMQCADIFFLKANICQLGMDQRKVLCSAFLRELAVRDVTPPSDALRDVSVSMHGTSVAGQHVGS
jgi:hypothetical protein